MKNRLFQTADKKTVNPERIQKDINLVSISLQNHFIFRIGSDYKYGVSTQNDNTTFN